MRGLRAVLVTPCWLRGRRLQALLHSPPAAQSRTAPLSALAPGALRLLAWLARIPASPWRNTCLFRCAAATLELRRQGHAAVLRLGAGSGPRAHAWVEIDGTVVFGERGHCTPFTAPH